MDCVDRPVSRGTGPPRQYTERKSRFHPTPRSLKPSYDALRFRILLLKPDTSALKVDSAHLHQSIMKTGGPNTSIPAAKADKRNAARSLNPHTGSVADPTDLESNRDGDNTSSRGSTEIRSPPVDPTCSLCHSRMTFIPIGNPDQICPLCKSNKNIVSRYDFRHASGSINLGCDTSCPGCKEVFCITNKLTLLEQDTPGNNQEAA